MGRQLIRANQRGFTIVEFMIATAVFSMILLIITVGVLSFSKSYIHGVNQSKTQQTLRSVANELQQAIQFSSTCSGTGGTCSQTGSSSTWQSLCFDNVEYSYELNTYDGLIRSSVQAGCAPVTSAGSADTDMLGTKMRLSQFMITQNGSSFTLSIHLIYGDKDLEHGYVAGSNPGDGTCAVGSGSQFCAAAQLDGLLVQQRI